ncbi:MAG: 2TM domain-containing protein [Bacteroidetes bacterium]|nr:2TM domain-containing protein [Bacteroidota bacterium]
MPNKIKPTGAQKSKFFIHLVIYLAASAAMILLYDKGATEWTYPWPAWIVAAWGLGVIGHGCAVYTSYEDKGMEEFTRQANN